MTKERLYDLVVRIQYLSFMPDYKTAVTMLNKVNRVATKILCELHDEIDEKTKENSQEN